jgi:UDP-N-acetylmuramoyl-L-alanyl-D-glutamate--2,6-diaminopimelate ligase
MEASSQGLKYHRTLGTRFAVGLFTNIGEDHISPIEHPTFEDYFASKLRIFDQSDCAVVNLGCDRAPEVVEAARRAPRLLTYADDASLGADVSLAALTHEGEGFWTLDVSTPVGRVEVGLDALGRFNVQNALAALAAAVALDVDPAVLGQGLRGIAVPGRMERYDAPDGSLVGIVDYAHNGMSMEALLRCVREEFPGRELTVVFGSTGEKAVTRRPGLGHAAGRWADRIVLTEDDPGRVPVAQICAELAAAIEEVGGAGHYTVVENRAEAVHEAVREARRPGVVVLAGKGAEDAILRAGGVEPCATDAQLICAELGCTGW